MLKSIGRAGGVHISLIYLKKSANQIWDIDAISSTYINLRIGMYSSAKIGRI